MVTALIFIGGLALIIQAFISLTYLVSCIHSQEALDQLRTSPYLKEMNRAVGIDRAIVRTINDIKEWLVTKFDSSFLEEIEELTYFIPWDIEKNMPKIPVDIAGVSLDTIWIA
jgi:hypothetical protein